ncbi:hypothetical protein FOL47_008086 [Perkinsus chesapeaki]|uniref:Uncharacterized protein n=1 Tax=Perkinsus chesapeaki TaxID=330153 RepID=A0A7J6MV99_PERCH|nr:hypothetical protein FOL47_008086 [Perkinsus chesapeaki]
MSSFVSLRGSSREGSRRSIVSRRSIRTSPVRSRPSLTGHGNRATAAADRSQSRISRAGSLRPHTTPAGRRELPSCVGRRSISRTDIEKSRIVDLINLVEARPEEICQIKHCKEFADARWEKHLFLEKNMKPHSAEDPAAEAPKRSKTHQFERRQKKDKGNRSPKLQPRKGQRRRSSSLSVSGKAAGLEAVPELSLRLSDAVGRARPKSAPGRMTRFQPLPIDLIPAVIGPSPQLAVDARTELPGKIEKGPLFHKIHQGDWEGVYETGRKAVATVCRSQSEAERYNVLASTMGIAKEEARDTEELLVELMGTLGCAMERLKNAQRARLVFQWCIDRIKKLNGGKVVESVLMFNLAVCSMRLGDYQSAFKSADAAVKSFILGNDDSDHTSPPLQLMILRLTAARKTLPPFIEPARQRGRGKSGLRQKRELLLRETQMWADFVWARDRIEQLRLEAMMEDEAIKNPRRKSKELPGSSISMVRRRLVDHGGGDRQRFQETAMPPTDEVRLRFARHTATSLLDEDSSTEAERRVVSDSLVRYGGTTPLGSIGVTREMIEKVVHFCEVRVSYPGLPVTIAGSPICVVLVLHGRIGRYRFITVRDDSSAGEGGLAALADDRRVHYERTGGVRAGEWILCDNPTDRTRSEIYVAEGQEHVEIIVIPAWVFSRLLHEVAENLRFSIAAELSTFLFDCATLFSKPHVSRMFTGIGGYEVENVFEKKKYRLHELVFEPCGGKHPPGLVVVMSGKLELKVVSDDCLKIGMGNFDKDLVLKRTDKLGLSVPNPLAQTVRHEILRALGMMSERYLTEEKLEWRTTLVPGDVLCLESLVGGWGVSHICRCEVVSLSCELLVIPPVNLADANQAQRMKPLVEMITSERDEARNNLIARLRRDSVWRRKKEAFAGRVRERQSSMLPRHMVRNFV